MNSPTTSRTRYLPVSDLHTIAYEQVGHGPLAVVLCHGGPGGSRMSVDPGTFAPSTWTAVTFDQRGCGQSTPLGSICENTAADLVGDMEALREHLGIERWVVAGHSWGSALATLYAQTHPDRTLGVMVAGVFLARQQDIDWAYAPEHVALELPDDYRFFRSMLRGADRARPVAAMGKLLAGESRTALAAAQRWNSWEAAICTLRPEHLPIPLRRPRRLRPDDSMGCDVGLEQLDDDLATLASAELRPYERHLIAAARVSQHFCANAMWMPWALLDRCAQIAHLPVQIVHGADDLLCPSWGAQALHDALPESCLQIVDGADHCVGFHAQWRAAARRLAAQLLTRA